MQDVTIKLVFCHFYTLCVNLYEWEMVCNYGQQQQQQPQQKQQ